MDFYQNLVFSKNPEHLMTTSKITFGAGCFWGVQHILDELPGVTSTRCGYMGGTEDNANYKAVCSGETGHAEVVEVVFNESEISLSTLLDYFWRLHDPTQFNRQGVDVGSQYRSVIFYYNNQQKELAEKSKQDFDNTKIFPRPAVTQILPAADFFTAEEYHQKYFKQNGGHVCHVLRLR